MNDEFVYIKLIWMCKQAFPQNNSLICRTKQHFQLQIAISLTMFPRPCCKQVTLVQEIVFCFEIKLCWNVNIVRVLFLIGTFCATNWIDKNVCKVNKCGHAGL